MRPAEIMAKEVEGNETKYYVHYIDGDALSS